MVKLFHIACSACRTSIMGAFEPRSRLRMDCRNRYTVCEAVTSQGAWDWSARPAETETECSDESLPRNHWRDLAVISCGYEWINFRVLWKLGKIYRLQAKLDSHCKSVTSRPRQYSVVHFALAAPAGGPNLVHRFSDW